MSKIFQWLIVVLASFLAASREAQPPDFSAIRNGFLHPPDSVRVTAFYYWLNNHISEQGVIKDLHAMKEAGITRVFIGTNIRNRTDWSGDTTGQWFGKVNVFSDEWWKIVHTALKTAADLDIEVVLFNCPGWSQSGGPWVKPGQAMRYLDASEIRVKGPAKISRHLVATDTFFQDVKVLAIRVAPGYQQNLLDLAGVKINSSNLMIANAAAGNQPRYALMGKESMINIELARETTVRSFTFYPSEYFNAVVDVQVKVDTGYQSLQHAEVIRSTTVEDLAKGFEPHAPYFLALDEVTAKSFRLVFTNNGKGQSELDNMIMSATPVIENLPEKKLAKVKAVSPSWTASINNEKAAQAQQPFIPKTKDVIDISKYMTADGMLNWNAPEGEWIIMRTGMRFIDVKNGPASFEAEGLEVDKMNKEHVEMHYNTFIGQILKRVPAHDRRTLKLVIMDSYERGGFNFTDGLLADFKKRYGYDATHYLPVYSGHVIGSVDLTDRFLWDLRRMVADKLADEYVGGMTEVSHQNGLKTWVENYGHSGFPGEFLQYGGQADEVSGEYWVEPISDRRFENRAAASTAHIYGKNKVWSESFTSGSWTKSFNYSTYPKKLKSLSDQAFTQGVNSTVLHLYVQQPYENIYPGVDAWFGTEFNRKNTWFSHLDLFTLYHRRCNFMLQQGKNIADVAYYIGEDNPVMRGSLEPKLPQGYNYDFINAEVILRDMTVKDGRFLLPDGTTYKVLVLPAQNSMRPEVLKKIKRLVAAGGIILGNPPMHSPSLQDYPQADKLVQQLARQLWGIGIEKKRQHGKGFVFNRISLEELFQTLSVTADFSCQNTAIQFSHRSLDGKEIYFLANTSGQPVAFDAGFRTSGLQPECWDPLTGATRLLPGFRKSDTHTFVPLQLTAHGSMFIVFQQKGAPTADDVAANFPEPTLVTTITNPWKVVFEHDSNKRGPGMPILFNALKDWATFDDDRTRYYSGKAIYSTTFTVPDISRQQQYFLDLGAVVATAKIKVNGKDAGGAWTYPYRVNVGRFLKAGMNTLEVEVINTWKNRLIGDHLLPEQQRIVYSRINPWNGDTILQQSGLLGPVQLVSLVE